MVIVDTSVFIELLRGRRSTELETLIVAGLVGLSSTVHLELLYGVRKIERKSLKQFLTALGQPLSWPSLDVCSRIVNISSGSGLRVGLPDIMILADCLMQKASFATLDTELRKLSVKAAIPLVDVGL